MNAERPNQMGNADHLHSCIQQLELHIPLDTQPTDRHPAPVPAPVLHSREKTICMPMTHIDLQSGRVLQNTLYTSGTSEHQYHLPQDAAIAPAHECACRVVMSAPVHESGTVFHKLCALSNDSTGLSSSHAPATASPKEAPYLHGSVRPRSDAVMLPSPSVKKRMRMPRRRSAVPAAAIAAPHLHHRPSQPQTV